MQVMRCVFLGLFLCGSIASMGQSAAEHGDGGRKLKSKVVPSYPELARRMKITGVVKVQIVIAPNGTVKETKLVGGHPLLANSVLDATRKWRYEPSSQETTEDLQFRFDPTD